MKRTVVGFGLVTMLVVLGPRPATAGVDVHLGFGLPGVYVYPPPVYAPPPPVVYAPQPYYRPYTPAPYYGSIWSYGYNDHGHYRGHGHGKHHGKHHRKHRGWR
jgi:hypothetical protein